MSQLLDETAQDCAFVALFNLIAQRVHQTAKDKGWWDKPRSIAEQIALQHAELSEALEGARDGNPLSEKIPEFTSLEEEYADLIIRVMDSAAAMQLRVAEAIIAKAQYNQNRLYRHGNKVF